MKVCFSIGIRRVLLEMAAAACDEASRAFDSTSTRSARRAEAQE